MEELPERRALILDDSDGVERAGKGQRGGGNDKWRKSSRLQTGERLLCLIGSQDYSMADLELGSSCWYPVGLLVRLYWSGSGKLAGWY